jgi:hypothetical protein
VAVSLRLTEPPLVVTGVTARTSFVRLLMVAERVTEPLAGVTLALIALADTTFFDDVDRALTLVPAALADLARAAVVATATTTSDNLLRLISTSLLWSPQVTCVTLDSGKLPPRPGRRYS